MENDVGCGKVYQKIYPNATPFSKIYITT